MSGRRRHQLSPTLFPFLAVLVCTLGTLILFLALVAENATSAAAQESKNAARPSETKNHLTAAAVNSMIEEAEFRVTELVAFREQQVADIGQRRDQLTHLDDHVNRLRDELNQLNEEIEIAIGEKKADSVDPQKLANLKQLLESETQQIEKLRTERGRSGATIRHCSSQRPEWNRPSTCLSGMPR